MKNFLSSRKERGATLAELCVVLAVISVISVMVSSFILTLNQKNKISSAKLNAMQDLYVIENTAEKWTDIMAAEGASFSVENGELFADVGGNRYKLSFFNGELKAFTVSGDPVRYFSDTVSSLFFDLLTQEDGNTLIFCTVNYEIPKAQKGAYLSYERTFCIDPRYGEIISSQGGNS